MYKASKRKPQTRWVQQTRWSLRRARKIRLMLQLTILVIIFIIILPAWIIYKPPRWLVNSFARRYPDVLFHLNTNEKVVALTIDDAPTQYTAEIISLLKEHDATATFFVIGGQVNDDRKSLLEDIIRQGSELGNHAMHDEPSVSLTSDVLESEISQVEIMIERAYQTVGGQLGQRGRRWFRPGSGFFSRRLVDIATKANYETALGDIFPHDPVISLWRMNAWHVLSSLRPGGIIIVHDRRSWTVPLLKKILPAMKQQGYKVVSLTKAMELSKG